MSATHALTLRSAVEGLFAGRRPSAITGAVRAVIVNAIDRVIRRWLGTHIGEEQSKTQAPAFADGNPTAAVISPSFISRIQASVFHRDPSCVFSSLMASIRLAMAMRGQRFSHQFCAETATGRDFALSEMASTDSALTAAIASANPISISTLNRRAPQYEQSAKPSVSMIVFPHSLNNSMIVLATAWA